MSAAQKLREDYERKLKRLQDRCPHPRRTEWLEESWAPGHFTGRRVQLCADCDKVLATQLPCHVCGRGFPENELRHGDGHVLPLDGRYCKRCYEDEYRTALETQKQLAE